MNYVTVNGISFATEGDHLKDEAAFLAHEKHHGTPEFLKEAYKQIKAYKEPKDVKTKSKATRRPLN